MMTQEQLNEMVARLHQDCQAFAEYLKSATNYNQVRREELKNSPQYLTALADVPLGQFKDYVHKDEEQAKQSISQIVDNMRQMQSSFVGLQYQMDRYLQDLIDEESFITERAEKIRDNRERRSVVSIVKRGRKSRKGS